MFETHHPCPHFFPLPSLSLPATRRHVRGGCHVRRVRRVGRRMVRHGDTATGTNDAAAVLNAKKKKKTYITPLVQVVSYKEYEKKNL